MDERCKCATIELAGDVVSPSCHLADEVGLDCQVHDRAFLGIEPGCLKLESYHRDSRGVVTAWFSVLQPIPARLSTAR